MNKLSRIRCAHHRMIMMRNMLGNSKEEISARLLKYLLGAIGEIDKALWDLFKSEYLATQHTRQLLDGLSKSRATGIWYPIGDNDGFTTEQIKSALAGREHIMNKKEASEWRRKKQKKGV